MSNWPLVARLSGETTDHARRRARLDDMIVLLTTGLLILLGLAVGVVLAWAESRARRREAALMAPRLTHALLAGPASGPRDAGTRPGAGVSVKASAD
jgi:hypothetical protein